MAVSNKRKEVFLESMATTGRITESCQVAGISYEAVRVWRKEDEAFIAAFEESEARYCDKIEKEIERRAIEGWDEPVFQNGTEVGKKRRFSDTLLLALTKSRMAKYRDKAEVDVRVKGQILAIPMLAQTEEGFDELVRKSDSGDAEGAQD